MRIILWQLFSLVLPALGALAGWLVRGAVEYSRLQRAFRRYGP